MMCGWRRCAYWERACRTGWRRGCAKAGRDFQAQTEEGRGMRPSSVVYAAQDYQTLHFFAGSMGWPTWQLKALSNCGMLSSTPLTRMASGACGSDWMSMRVICGRMLEHQ